MTSTYLINQLVQFIPDENVLVRMDNEQMTITLPVSASRCLQLFIEARTMVTQRQLFEYAWGSDAGTVTPNNLYQNISLLRKALKKLTSDDNSWIITTPRKGFRLDEHLQIDVVSLNKTPERSPEISQTRASRHFGVVRSKLFSNRTFIAVGFYFLLALSSLSVLIVADMIMFPKTTLAHGFMFFKPLQNCKIYINKDAIDTSTHMAIFSVLKPACQQRKYVYITAYPILHSATMLLCNKELEDSNVNCIFHLVRDFKP